MTPKRSPWWLLLEWLGACLFAVLPDTDAVNRAVARLFYFVYNGWKTPSLDNPRNFNEKLITLKLSDEPCSPLRAHVTDKEFLKGHATAVLGPGHVIPTLAVLRTARQVDRFEFPLPCVVKPTHSSQEVMHLSDRQPGVAERRRLKYWLAKSYFPASREPNYRGLDKKLIVEPVLGGVFGALEDVKVLCFHGRPKLIQVDRNRYDGHRRDYFDIWGRPLPVTMRKPAAGEPFPFPDELADIRDIAVKLSAGSTFLRVDLYVVDGLVIVGELTSFPTNCTIPFQPPEADRKIAALFDDPAIEVTPAYFGAAESSGEILPFPRPVPAADSGAATAQGRAGVAV